MKRRIDKFHVSQIIRHTESHNRAKEEQYMWLHRRDGQRKYDEKSKGYSKPEAESSKRAKFSYDLEEEKSVRKVIGPESDVNRWGHGGYWELYPCELSPSRVEKEKSKRHELKSERKSLKKKKHRRDRRTKKAERKEKRGHSKPPASDLEISAESELDDASKRRQPSNQQPVSSP